MPWQRRDVIQFVILLLCVPLQYYLSGYFYSNVEDKDRSEMIMNTIRSLERLKDNFLNKDYWATHWKSWAEFLLLDVIGMDEDEEISPINAEADENSNSIVYNNYDPVVDATHVRQRPAGLLYRVGQVVQLKNVAYRGIIIGWEYDTEEGGQPIYRVILDESHIKQDILSAEIQVEQDKFYIIKNFEISHYLLNRYFISFDGSQYIPRKWLRKIYPKD